MQMGEAAKYCKKFGYRGKCDPCNNYCKPKWKGAYGKCERYKGDSNCTMIGDMRYTWKCTPCYPVLWKESEVDKDNPFLDEDLPEDYKKMKLSALLILQLLDSLSLLVDLDKETPSGLHYLFLVMRAKKLISHIAFADDIIVFLNGKNKAGERIRIAYEKKCKQLRNQDVKGEDPSSVEKTRAAIRDMLTQMKVSIHSVEAVSKRIETLRDEELQPQLLELVQGLSRMWNAMAEGHQLQKRTLDEAKILLAGMPSKLSRTKKYTVMTPSLPQRLARSASNLEMELRNWRACFDSWIVSQRSYVQALTGWLLRCVRSDADKSKIPFSPRRSSAGVGSLYAQQLREDSRKNLGGSKRFGDESVRGMEMVEVGQFEDDVMSLEKMSEIAIRVLCAGMSVAVSSLT
ncbi:hypothetical protein Adt_07814, partial [Abeliophyllum distichum]